MSYGELVKAIAMRTSVSEREIRIVLRSFMDVTEEVTELGERVVLPGFGVFVLSKSKPRALFGGTRTTSGKKIKFHEARSK